MKADEREAIQAAVEVIRKYRCIGNLPRLDVASVAVSGLQHCLKRNYVLRGNLQAAIDVLCDVERLYRTDLEPVKARRGLEAVLEAARAADRLDPRRKS